MKDPNDQKLSYADRRAARDLLQDVVNEENAERAEQNPEFAKQLDAVGRAMKILTEANMCAVLWTEMNSIKQAPMYSFNNFSEISDQREYGPEAYALNAHSLWWKQANAYATLFACHYVKKDLPMWFCGITVMMSFLKKTYQEWMDVLPKK